MENQVTISLDDYNRLYDLKKKVDELGNVTSIYPVRCHLGSGEYLTYYHTESVSVKQLADEVKNLNKTISGLRDENHALRLENVSLKIDLGIEPYSIKKKPKVDTVAVSDLLKMNIFQLWKWQRSLKK